MIVTAGDTNGSLTCEATDYLWPWTRSAPVVMVHGYARNASVWMRWLPMLSQDRRIYRITLPGMGGTEPPGPGFDWETTPQLFSRVLEQLGVSGAHWIGESSGGMLATKFATQFPERVASLTLIETPLRRERALRREHTLGQATFAETMAQYGMEEYCRRTIDARLDTSKASPQLIEWYISQIAKTPADVGVSFKAFVDTIDLEPILKDVRVPIFMQCGDKSRVITPEQVETIRCDLANVEIKIYEGFGHGLNVLEPERCARETIAFWNRLPARLQASI